MVTLPPGWSIEKGEPINSFIACSKSSVSVSFAGLCDTVAGVAPYPLFDVLIELPHCEHITRRSLRQLILNKSIFQCPKKMDVTG